MKAKLSFERHLRHSPERVWKALTDRTILSRWYLDNDFSPVVGHRFTFHPDPDTGFDGILCGEVILVDEPYQL
ncbi:MAG: SRPBCC domain-containing protein, partial [Anaerolineae bacterium]|nr:SRPBCC domain-containing protein [Anaerolineae bacterium]